MTLTLLYTEALALVWFSKIRTVTWEEVVAWADDWISNLDEPPYELLDLSLSGGRPDEAVTLLHQLAHRGDPARALPLFVRRVWDGVQMAELSTLRLPRNLEHLDLLNDRGMPEDVRLPDLPTEFSSAVHDLYLQTEPWDPDWTPDLTAEVMQTLQRFL